MTNPTRDRAKEHFPAVLLTLLSVVQAIALELLFDFPIFVLVIGAALTASFLCWQFLSSTKFWNAAMSTEPES